MLHSSPFWLVFRGVLTPTNHVCFDVQVLQLQKYKESTESLEDSFCGLQTAHAEVKDMLASREALVKTMEEENRVLRDDLLKLQEVYREKCEELRKRNESSTCFCQCDESLVMFGGTCFGILLPFLCSVFCNDCQFIFELDVGEVYEINTLSPLQDWQIL